MISFDKSHYAKFTDYSLKGTGFLAYRDLDALIQMNSVNMDKVLDLGCASGRSTYILSKLAKEIYATDLSKEALEFVRNKVTPNVFINEENSATYSQSRFSAIFSIFTFAHLQTLSELSSELKKCYASLDREGHLVIVVPHFNLFTRHYSSVEAERGNPTRDGQIVELQLKNIGVTVQNCYWKNETIERLAFEVGFKLTTLHFPLGSYKDGMEYFDELTYPPYVYMVFRKND